MARRRPCRICRHWFTSHPRAGPRQRVCSRTECQRERHRRACARWRQRHPDAGREERLRRRLRPGEGRVSWSVARDAVGPEVVVVVEEAGTDLRLWVRDVVTGQLTGRQKVGGKVPPWGARDAIATGGPPG